MKDTIELKGRNGELHKLVKQPDGKYKLECEGLAYRVGFPPDTTLDSREASFIDPSGGPFIQKGYEIEGYIVKSLTMDGYIEFEE